MIYEVLSSAEIRRLEQKAVAEGCSEESFMHEAGKNVAEFVFQYLEKHHLPRRVTLLVGKGNKGGDALVCGIELAKRGVHVRALCFYHLSECSELNQKFTQVFQTHSWDLLRIESLDGLSFEEDGVIVDGLLGTGFQGSVVGFLASLIAFVNASKAPIISIDVPSGLNATTGEALGGAIFAKATISLGFMKAGFFLRDGWNHVGDIHVRSFGLPMKYQKEASSIAKIICLDTLRQMLPPIVRNRYKYQAGYVLGFSGSNHYRGAPKIAGLSSLRIGAGIVRVMTMGEVGEAPLSVILHPWEKELWKKELKRASSVFLGPGVGDLKKAVAIIRKELSRILIPCVIDAEAIQEDFEYPPFSILTPHRGEVLRLLGVKKVPNEEDLMVRCQKWANRSGCILVLKGAPTWVFSPHFLPIIVPHGDPGMAKPGVGDVLTGVIAGLLAQKVSPLDAAVLGVYVHAKAGELAAREKTSYSVIADDIIDKLPFAIRSLIDEEFV